MTTRPASRFPLPAMSPTRRDFLKNVGKGAAATGALSLLSHDLVAQLVADSPKGKVAESRFKGLADIALIEAKTGGTSYADIRFTMTLNPPGATAMFRADGAAGAGGGR